MAHFAPLPGHTAAGWDAAQRVLKLEVGKDAEFGLYGGGYAGGGGPSDLEVKPVDALVVTVHEGPRPSASAWRTLVLLALKEGHTDIHATVPGTGAAWASMSVDARGHSKVRLIFYPGERLTTSATVGTIYVVGGNGERFAGAGGPERRARDGNHYVTPTPAGIYTLGPKVHHTTKGWPMSVIPFGANLRINPAGEVEYSDNWMYWRLATGPQGTVTKAYQASLRARHVPFAENTTIREVREIFIHPFTGALRTNTYILNDFGRWSWNLRRNGKPTVFYIHTTPLDEANTMSGHAVDLENSHGCVHIKPSERDRMMAAGFLQEGVTFEVRQYVERGPP
jgi:hypothetical protein